MSSQGEVVVKASFTAWHELAVEIRFEKMRENFAEMKNRGNESSRRMLQMMLGSQGELVLKSTFTAWKDALSVLKQEREIESVKRKMKANGEERTKRMLAMLMGSQG